MTRKSTDNSSSSKSVRRSTRKSPASVITKRIRRNSATGSNEKDGSSISVSTNGNVPQTSEMETSNETPGTSGTNPMNLESAGSFSQYMDLISKYSANPTIQYLKFHAVHGKNVSLNATRTNASRNNDVDNLAYVFIDHALKLEESIYVKLLRTNSEFNGDFLYGFTSCDPSTLNPHILPENTDELLDRPEYWIVQEDTHSYEAEDNFVFRINKRGEVSVEKNFVEKATAFHVDPSQPLWLFFNMVGSVTEMIAQYSTIPASAISEGLSISSSAVEMAWQPPYSYSRIPETSSVSTV